MGGLQGRCPLETCLLMGLTKVGNVLAMSMKLVMEMKMKVVGKKTNLLKVGLGLVLEGEPPQHQVRAARRPSLRPRLR